MDGRRLRRRLRALFGRSAVERELGEEMRFHLEMEARDLMRARGLSAQDAERQARLRFGSIDGHTEAHRDARGVRFVEDSLADLRYAFRALRRSPAFTASAVLVLGLGVGASAAIFSAVNAVLVSHLPYPGDDRLVRIVERNSPTNQWGLSVVDYRAIEAQSRTLSAVGALVGRDVPVSAGGLEPARTRTTLATAGLFAALGVHAARGRVLTAADERQSAPLAAVLSDAYAARAFGSAAAAAGKTILIDGASATVVGVLPPGVHDLAGIKSEIWPNWQPATPTRRGPFGVVGIARMKDGVSLSVAAADLAGISARLFPIWLTGFHDQAATLTPLALREYIVGRDAPKTLWMFAAAAALLLLTAVANVANLMLARSAARAREMSLRATLGASRTRLARLVIAETTLVSAAGALCGIVLSVLILKTLMAIASTMPRLNTAVIDGRVLAYAVGVALLTGILIGVHPVLALARSGRASLQVGGGQREVGQGVGGTRLRGALVALEFALALPLLAGAGLLIQSIAKLQRVDPGFDPSRVAYARVVLPQAGYRDPASVQGYWQRAMDAVRQVPGVAAVGYSSELPPAGLNNTNDFLLPSHLPAAGAPGPQSPWLLVSPGYFSAIHARLLAGRMFTPADTGPAESLIVSESWARQYTPDQSPVGQRIFEGGCTATTCSPEYIVGLVSDVKYDGLSGRSDATYAPTTQGFNRAGYLIVRTSQRPAKVLGSLRAALRALDPTVPVDETGSMDERVYESTAQPRHWALLLAAFAAAALLLAAVGIFGLLSYMVATTRREIGVRVALGAQRGAIARMVVRRGLANALVGAALGLAIALAGRRVVAGLLFGVTASDPATLAVVTLALTAVAFAACWLPARSAASVQPMEAIRGE